MFQARTITGGDKTEFYRELAQQLGALLSGEADPIANAANTAALLIRTTLLGFLCCLGAGIVGLPAPAAADTCDDLWYSRNEVYQMRGYCFKTTRAIRAFGNAGCQYDDLEDVPLSSAQRRMVADLLREERALGCPR